MHGLFEEYVAKMLERMMKGSGQRVVAQGGLLHCLEDSVSGVRRFRTKPDILVKQEASTNLVLDTKWKCLAPFCEDPKQGVSQSDVYQMMAYGQLYRCAKLLLLYPHHALLEEEPSLLSRHRIVGSDSELLVGSIDLTKLPTVPEQLRTLFRDVRSKVRTANRRHQMERGINGRWRKTILSMSFVKFFFQLYKLKEESQPSSLQGRGTALRTAAAAA